MPMKPEHLYSASKDQLNLVLSFFSRVESKLSVVFAIDTSMLALLVTNSRPLKTFSLPAGIACGLTVVLIATSIIFLYRACSPGYQVEKRLSYTSEKLRTKLNTNISRHLNIRATKRTSMIRNGAWLHSS
jgi:hypothetical protein